MKEIWKDIPNYEGKYQISNFGKIKSLNYNKTKQEKILKPDVRRGYLSVTLFKNNIRNKVQIHRIVASVFIPNELNLPYVNHIDGNKQNNNVENLEWCTHKENINHAIRTNLRNFYMDKNPNAKKINQYDKNGIFIKQWNCIKEITNELGVSRDSVYESCTNKRKVTKGYIWKYADK